MSAAEWVAPPVHLIGSSDEMRVNDAAQSISGLNARKGVLRNDPWANHRGYQ